MAIVGFFESFVGKNRSGRAFGPTWIRRIVCLRTASMEWNVPAWGAPFLPESEGAGDGASQ